MFVHTTAIPTSIPSKENSTRTSLIQTGTFKLGNIRGEANRANLSEFSDRLRAERRKEVNQGAVRIAQQEHAVAPRHRWTARYLPCSRASTRLTNRLVTGLDVWSWSWASLGRPLDEKRISSE